MGRLDVEYVSEHMRKAEIGKPDDQFRVGLMYSVGNGVPLDLVIAHKWFNLAAMSGNDEARANRAEIAMDMSPDEISEAQKLAREWVLSH
jgi:uncharacterized protein